MGKANYDEITIAEQAVAPATPTSGFGHVYPKPDGKLYYKNSSGVETELTNAAGGGGIVDNYIELAVAFSSNVVARANVTGWTVSMATGKNYLIEIIADYQTAATTTGGSLGFVMTTGTATIKGKVEGDISQAIAATGLNQPIYAISSSNTLAGSFFTSTGVTVINSPHGITARLYVKCTASGVFNVQWASEVAASAAQLNAGSLMIWRQTN